MLGSFLIGDGWGVHYYKRFWPRKSFMRLWDGIFLRVRFMRIGEVGVRAGFIFSKVIYLFYNVVDWLE